MKLQDRKRRVYIEPGTGIKRKLLLPGDSTMNIKVGTVTTGAPDENAVVTNSGTSKDPILNFKIIPGEKGKRGGPGPEGPPGDKGGKGIQGIKGAGPRYFHRIGIWYRNGKPDNALIYVTVINNSSEPIRGIYTAEKSELINLLISREGVVNTSGWWFWNSYTSPIHCAGYFADALSVTFMFSPDRYSALSDRMHTLTFSLEYLNDPYHSWTATDSVIKI